MFTQGQSNCNTEKEVMLLQCSSEGWICRLGICKGESDDKQGSQSCGLVRLTSFVLFCILFKFCKGCYENRVSLNSEIKRKLKVGQRILQY